MLGDSMRRRGRASKPEAREYEPRYTPGMSLGRWLLLGLGVLVGSFGVGYLLSTQVLFPRPETAGSGIAVPDLAGQSRQEAEATLRDAGLDIGEVREITHPGADPGQVLAQSPVPGMELRPGGSVSFAVSAGPPEPRVPPVAGLSAGTARDLLEQIGFTVEVKQSRSADVPEGIVDGTDPPAGAPRPVPSTVTMIVSAGLAEDTASSDTAPSPTEAPRQDTLPGRS